MGGQGLTDVVGLGTALKTLAAQRRDAVAARLRPYVTFVVKNDGFVLTKDAALIRTRLSVMQPSLNEKQLDRRVKDYLDDISALEGFLGAPVEQLTSAADRKSYDQRSRRLFGNPSLKKYLRGEDLKLNEWRTVMDDVVHLLGHAGWNRVG